MIRTENVLFLKKYFPNAWDKLRDLDYSDRAANVKAVPAKKGPLTLMIGEEARPAYLHSQYDPLNEAERFVRQYDDISGYEHIFFYGVGLGYHVKALLDRHPDVSFTLYEPHPEIMYCWLSHDHLEHYPHARLKNIFVEANERERQQFLVRFANQVNGQVLLVVWPAYERLFKKQYQQFLQDFKEKVSDRRSALHVNLAFEKRWTINSLLNLKYTLQTPNILHDVDKTYFKFKPAILVAAGPSLQYEFDNLRKIKEEGRAYIFSVGSAINALIEQDILPHAACTYDPTVNNQLVFKKLKERQIDIVPLIYGSSVGYETLVNYPGPMLHMITSQDTVTPFYVQHESEQSIDCIQDAPSISVVTLQLLYKLGCNPIILVGQDLAYPDRQRYAAGIEYSHVAAMVSDEEIRQQGLQYVEDVHGNKVLSSPGFIRMKRQLELYIKTMDNLKVINTSRDGARIEGTIYQPLSEVIEEYLKESYRVVDNWWKIEPQYDYAFTLEQCAKMEQEWRELQTLRESVLDSLRQIKEDVTLEKTDRLQRLFKRLDKGFKRLQRNKFFVVYLQPILRVENEMLARSAKQIRFESDLIKKGEQVVHTFANFIHHMDQRIKVIMPLIKQAHSDLKKLVSRSESRLEEVKQG